MQGSRANRLLTQMRYIDRPVLFLWRFSCALWRGRNQEKKAGLRGGSGKAAAAAGWV